MPDQNKRESLGRRRMFDEIKRESLTVKPMDINDLLNGKIKRLPISMGGYLKMCVEVSLARQRHASPTVIVLKGFKDPAGDLVDMAASLEWSKPSEDEDGILDRERPTEDGAYGIALLAIQVLTEYQYLKAAWKGRNSGFDFWLSKEGEDFQNAARLEVSGIAEDTPQKIQGRVRQKVEQVKASNGTGLPALVVIIGFRTPIAVANYA